MTGTRNAILDAELAAAIEKRRNRPQDPLAEEVAKLISGDMTEEELEARFIGGLVERTSYRCEGSLCGHHVFSDGDVIHRRRITTDSRWGRTWSHSAFCEQCVSAWHPSWLQSREEPEPCAAGCGALVSSWGYEFIRTCSKRCAEIVDRQRREQRRVVHEPRACEACGHEFTPTRSDSRYCSNACRQRAYRERSA